jgi:hypothetical protein
MNAIETHKLKDENEILGSLWSVYDFEAITEQNKFRFIFDEKIDDSGYGTMT